MTGLPEKTMIFEIFIVSYFIFKFYNKPGARGAVRIKLPYEHRISDHASEFIKFQEICARFVSLVVN